MIIEYFATDGISKTKTPLGINNKMHQNRIWKLLFMTLYVLVLQRIKKDHVSQMMNQVEMEKSKTGGKFSTHFVNYQNRDTPALTYQDLP